MSTRSHWSPSAVAVLVALISTPVSGQFASLIPRPQSTDLARTASIRRALSGKVDAVALRCASADSSATERSRCRLAATDTLTALAFEYCFASNLGDPARAQACQDSVAPVLADILRTGRASPKAFYFPLRSGREGLVRYFAQAGDLQVLSKFAAGMRDDQIFVLTDIVSGAIGIIPFGITSASIVTKDDTTSTPNGAGVVEGLTSDLTRLINNGGTITARALLPLMVTEGTNIRSSVGTYGQLGLLGPLSEPDSLQASGALATEALVALAVRKPDDTAEHVADVIVGGKLAYGWAERSLAPGVIDEKGFWFVQAGFGLVDSNGKLSLSFLLTRPLNSAVRPHVPKFMVNLAAIR